MKVCNLNLVNTRTWSTFYSVSKTSFKSIVWEIADLAYKDEKIEYSYSRKLSIPLINLFLELFENENFDLMDWNTKKITYDHFELFITISDVED